MAETQALKLAAAHRFQMERADELQRQVESLRAERDELNASFDLRWKADMRAIARWREAHPGNELVMPDHADLCVWLLVEMDALIAEKTDPKGELRRVYRLVKYWHELADAERDAALADKERLDSGRIRLPTTENMYGIWVEQNLRACIDAARAAQEKPKP